MGEEFWAAYRDPKWIEKRKKILERDGFKCQYYLCDEETENLHVHHNFYLSQRKPWEYPDEALTTLCKHCHEYVTGLHVRLREALCKSSIETLEEVLGFLEMQVAMELPMIGRKKLRHVVKGLQKNTYFYGLFPVLERFRERGPCPNFSIPALREIFWSHDEIDLHKLQIASFYNIPYDSVEDR